jgi:GNAT superfamily N-acetyltransferase
MTSELKPNELTSPADRMAIKPLGVDDWAGVRYVHTSAFRGLAGTHFSETEVDAFTQYARSQDYADRLLLENLHTGWLDGELVGTAGWTPADDCGSQARITSVFVRPLFTRMGLGRRLVLDAEARARAAGFQRLCVRATLNCVGFFEKLDYDVTSYGVQAIMSDQPMPVTYMRKRLPLNASIEVAPAGRQARVVRASAAVEPDPSPELQGLVTPRGR